MRLPDAIEKQYPGRKELLETNNLRELWFHVTDNCNMSCRHCLFSSSPDQKQELSADKIIDLTAQAEKLGCKMFALTGGEPLIHKGAHKIINRMLETEKNHVAILTNGLSVKKFFSANRYDFTRCHLQISVDGIGETHDQIRGKACSVPLKNHSNGFLLKRFPLPFPCVSPKPT